MNADSARLLMVPIGLEAIEVCERIAGSSPAVVKLSGVGPAAAEQPSRYPAGEEAGKEEAERIQYVLAEIKRDRRIGGVMLVTDGRGAIDPAVWAAALRMNRLPVESVHIAEVGGAARAAEYGAALASDMLILLKHLQDQGVKATAAKKYVSGSVWLDDKNREGYSGCCG